MKLLEKFNVVYVVGYVLIKQHAWASHPLKQERSGDEHAKSFSWGKLTDFEFANLLSILLKIPFGLASRIAVDEYMLVFLIWFGFSHNKFVAIG